MKQNKLAIIIAYYLARFNREGLKKLGFSSFNEAFENCAKILNVKKNYIKLRRDEFDPVFPWRRGWQRPMDKQILRTIETFQDLEEEALFQIVKDILNKKSFREGEEVSDILHYISLDLTNTKRDFIVRGITGKKAEQFFIDPFNKETKPCEGILTDTRELGCGYDFLIQNPSKNVYVEVKGLSELTGGIVFTDKEWKLAEKKGDDYYLALVRNINEIPKLQFIQNPVMNLSAIRRIYTSVQVQWSVTNSEIDKFGRLKV